MTLFDLTQRDQKNGRLKEQMWLLLFVGADVKEIEELRAQSKRQQAETRELQVSDYSNSLGNTHAPAYLTLPAMADITGRPNPNIRHIDDPQMPSAQAHNVPDAFSGTNSNTSNIGRYDNTSRNLDVYTPKLNRSSDCYHLTFRTH